MKLSDYVFNFIVSNGIDTVFTVSGGGCMHLVDSLGRNKSLKYVCNHHEQACAMAAEGYARTSDKPGCILVTTGPGGTNALTGVLCAYQDSIPMIVLSGQVPTEQLSNGTSCRQIGQQEFNIVDTVKTMTKYSVVVTDKNKIRYELEKAYHLATSGRPGPVWIDIPLDIQASDINPSELDGFQVKNDFSYSIPSHIEKLETLKELLNKSKKPVIVVGGGVRSSLTTKQFNQFVFDLEIPVMTGPHSSVDVVNTDYKYYAGRFGLLGQYTSNTIIQNSDLVISIGSRLNPKMIGYDQSKFAPNATKVLIDVDSNEMKKLKFDSKVEWEIDLRDFFEIVNGKLEKQNIEEWRYYVLEMRSKEKLVLEKHYSLNEYVSTYVFSKKLENYLKDDSVIVTSDGTAHVVPLKTINLKSNQRLFSNEGTAPMGYGLPAAIGAHYGCNKPVICIEGDGSIMMNLQELETVRHNNIPIIIFIINNDGYLSIKLTQNSFFKGNLVASEKSSGVSIPRFDLLSNVFGFNYLSINTNNEIDTVLNEVFNEQNTFPMIVEVFSDPNEQHEPKVVAKGIDENGKIIPGELTNMNINIFEEN
jgi:acetolactate synthase I/II/III large subunit